jgi:hypothetical protein
MDIKMFVFADGPTFSLLTSPVAAGAAEAAAAICAFVIGSSVQASPGFRPADDEESAHAKRLQQDQSIPGLTHRGVSLDIFDRLESLGGDDGVSRALRALLAYHASMQQASPDVALMLLVSSIEALIAPRPKWGEGKVTKRFREALIDLCPEAVDKLLDRRNVEFEFSYNKKGGRRRQRIDLLEKIYELRSISAHSGLSLSGTSHFVLINPGPRRLAPLMDLASAAILSFLEAPRSYLTGHPMWEDDARSKQN